MSEQTINQIIPQEGATNETLIGDVTSYFRWNQETHNYEVNAKINPTTVDENWSVVPSPLRDAFVDPNRRPTVGAVIHDMIVASRRFHTVASQRDEIRQQAYRAIAVIGQRLIEESERRGWCDEFDRIIDEVNEDLPEDLQLPKRKRLTEHEINVRGFVDTSITVWVEEGEDFSDPDNWQDEEGNAIDGDDLARDALNSSVNSFGFDDWEIS